MSTPTPQQPRAHQYVLGHTAHEVERLKAQARLIDPVTERFFRAAGLAPGMRVLDVGSGAGDVAFLVATIVGPTGSVTGSDRAPSAVQVARARAADRMIQNVHFIEGDPATLAFEEPFDAIVGRYVLQFQQDPAAMLRQLGTKLRTGGLVVFHEIDWAGVSSFPPVASYDRCARWGADAMRLHGTETRMGSKLHSTFLAAGLAAPSLRLESLVVADSASGPWLALFADLIETLMPTIERFGVATTADVGLPTLLDRMMDEGRASSSVFFGHYQIGAWIRI